MLWNFRLLETFAALLAFAIVGAFEAQGLVRHSVGQTFVNHRVQLLFLLLLLALSFVGIDCTGLLRCVGALVTHVMYTYM